MRHGKHNGWPFADLSARTWAANCHTKLDGTFLLATRKGVSLTALGSFFCLSFVAFFRTRRLSESYPFCGFPLRPLSSLCCLYTVYYRKNI